MTAITRLAALPLAVALGAAALPAPRGALAQTAASPPAAGAEPAIGTAPGAGSEAAAAARPAGGTGPAAAAAPELPPPAPLAERWRFNPRERTARGLDAWEEDRPADADAAFTHALALAPGAGDPRALDPLLLLNAGTGRLAAGAPEEAAGLLAAAAERAGAEADPALETAARYNLGNARYAGGDYAAAAEAFRAVLRGDPDHAAAKHNLELALRRLAEQRRAQAGDGAGEEQPDQPGGEAGEGRGGGEGEGEPSPDRGKAGDEAPSEPAEDRPTDPGAAPRPRPGEEPGGGDRRDRPLPGFEDQPDMTAEQAASILEAVESLERQRRRAAAAERARRLGGERDW